MITFAEHQVRAGKAGAPGDFEQMLGLLVRATSGKDASLVFANPGDWGIDVLAGSLNGRVTVWQAKYFVHGIGRSQRAQIELSFGTVVAKAAEHGFTLERWVLCAPASMDTRTRQWWEGWKQAREMDTGVAIGLWDETVLRELLLTEEAADVYEEYYGTRQAPPGAAGAAGGGSGAGAAGGGSGAGRGGGGMAGMAGPVTVTATADRDAYAAGGDLSVHQGVGAKRLLLGVAGTVAVIVLVTAGALLFVAHGSRGGATPPQVVYARSAVRTPKAWAAQVNAVCRRLNPKLIADLRRAESFSQSDFGTVFTPMNPAVPQAFDQLYTDFSQTARLIQEVLEPTVQNAAVNDWLTDWTNLNTTLYKMDNDINGVNGDPIDRITSSYEIEKFTSEIDSMQPLAAEVGVPECA